MSTATHEPLHLRPFDPDAPAEHEGPVSAGEILDDLDTLDAVLGELAYGGDASEAGEMVRALAYRIRERGVGVPAPKPRRSEAEWQELRASQYERARVFAMPFGKHRGRTFGEIAVDDYQYLSWLARECQVGKVQWWARTFLQHHMPEPLTPPEPPPIRGPRLAT